MTLPRITAYRKYWQQHPPVHTLVAGYMGYTKQEPADPTELFSMFPGGVIKG